MLDLQFSGRRIKKVWFSRLKRRSFWKQSVVSEEHIASNFRVEIAQSMKPFEALLRQARNEEKQS
jgi:hypothetical protein